jgi:hypothetical protein
LSAPGASAFLCLLCLRCDDLGSERRSSSQHEQIVSVAVALVPRIGSPYRLFFGHERRRHDQQRGRIGRPRFSLRGRASRVRLGLRRCLEQQRELRQLRQDVRDRPNLHELRLPMPFRARRVHERLHRHSIRRAELRQMQQRVQ